ncbi:hypothetical protein EMPS_05418 [Entomortierella parvispora]|uniref:FH2 domain-containing protein n=1 Tax=Entomortierella parvispora TaxID=205924 RepID=A0A9P3LWQ5_9FUNG|nr:hypothetical protein EMPS_05418 [Entomortierella parvispora]
MDKLLQLNKKRSSSSKRSSPSVSISFPSQNPLTSPPLPPSSSTTVASYILYPSLPGGHSPPHSHSPPSLPRSTYFAPQPQPRSPSSELVDSHQRHRSSCSSSSSSSSPPTPSSSSSPYTHANGTAEGPTKHNNRSNSSKKSKAPVDSYPRPVISTHSTFSFKSLSSPTRKQSGNRSPSSPTKPNVITTFTSDHQRASMDRSNTHGRHPSLHDNDAQSVRSHRTSASGTVSEAGRTEAMSLARPRTDQEIEDRFVDFMNNMGMHEPEQRKAMVGLSVDNKWKLIFQHESQEQTKARKREEGFVDKTSPEYFVRKLLSDADFRNMDPKVLVALYVSLKSQPISWVRNFIQSRGQLILCNALSSLNHRPSRRDVDLTIEHEIVKCLKTLLNNRWGAQEAIQNGECISALCFSITSPQLQTRKLVVEVLTFLCYCEVPSGHRLVLEGLDQVMDYWKESARFDAWMRILENTIDGRGRFGTIVGMSEDLKKAGTQDGQLIEYVLSNVVFVNALLQVVDDIELRVHLRSQLTTSGLTRIISKMRSLNHDLIDRQLNIYEDEAENDYEDMIEFYNHKILHDMSDPYDVFHALLRSVESSRAYDFFLSLLQHMLLIREEGDMRIRYFQLMDAIVTQVVLDRRGVTDDFDQKLGISVNQLVSKLVDQDRLQLAIEDAKQARHELEIVSRVKNELELEVGQKDEGMVSQLKANIFSLEDLLRLSRHTIQTLQAKLSDVETQTANKLAIQDAQLKHLLKSLSDANTLMAEAGMPSGVSIGTGGKADAYPMMDKDTIRRLIEQTKLEGAILQERYGNHLPRTLAAPDPALAKDIEKLNGYQYTGPATLPPELLASIANGGQLNGRGGKGSKQGTGNGNGGTAGGMVMDMTGSGGPPPPPPPPGGIPPPPPPPPIAGGLGGLLGNMIKSNGLKGTGGNGGDSDSEDTPVGGMAAMLAAKKKQLGGGTSSPTSSAPSAPKVGGPPPPPPPPPPGGAGGPPPPPPPPPPPGKGGPPPPPGGPPGPGMMNMNKKKEGATAAIKLKALQWDKLNYMAVGNTVWGSGGVDESALQKALGENGVFGSMEQLFVAKVAEYKEPRASKKPQEILIVDHRRAHQVNIMLGGMKHTYPQIRHAILRMDEEFMTLVQLSNLLKFVPDAEETGKLLEYKDASEDVLLTLGRPEAFFVEMLKIERYQQRLEGLKFKMTFHATLDGVNESIASITNASKGLKNAKHFKELLNLILMLGNYMNGASHNGGAFGFKIASINKLVDTKASNAPNMTLLHFLSNITETTLPHVLNYQTEIGDCGDACRVSLPELKTEFNQLKTKLMEIKTELQTHYVKGYKSHPEDRFYQVMQPFIETAERSFQLAEKAMIDMECLYKDCVKFYGEDSSVMKPDEFFGIFKTFSTSFEKARDDNKKQKEKEFLREKAKTAAKARQEQMAAKKNRIHVKGEGSHGSEGGGDDKGMMDSLLETLRNGGDNEASRRDRRRAKNRDMNSTPAIAAIKAQDLLTSLREDSTHITLLHE